MMEPHIPCAPCEYMEPEADGNDMPLKLGDDMVEFLQEVSNAIGDLPGVWDRVEAYLLGRGIDNPRQEWDRLRSLLF